MDSSHTVTAPPAASVVVITPGNTWAHAYSDVEDMIEDLGPSRIHSGLDHYDNDGQHYAPAYSRSGYFMGLKPTPGGPDPDLVQRRLTAVVQHVEDHLRRHPEILERNGLLPEQAPALLPAVAGQSLAATLDIFARWGTPHAAVLFHNLLHTAGRPHD